jgi:hypothetical protein
MNTYEDRYLLERMKKIIAAQKESKILVAAYTDGTGLPIREDLGLEIERAPSPYDYTVGKVGYLTYHAGLSLYIFTPRAGGRLPPVLANKRPLQLGEAHLDVEGRTIRIQSEDTRITFTGVQPWKGLYEILREVNEQLAKSESGIVVWRIIPEESKGIPRERLFPADVPTLRNGQAMAHLSGYAFDEDQMLIYANLVGYKTAIESLRVTIQSGKRLQLIQERTGNLTLTPADRYEQVWQALPEYTSHQMAMVSRQALPGKWEPEDTSSFLLVFHGTPKPEEELMRLFIERIKEALEIPILDEWVQPLWQSAWKRSYLSSLSTGGDCIRAVQVHLQSNWQDLVTELLAEEEISLAN